MSINLLDMLKDQVTGSLAKQASGFLGESESNVTSALGNIFPSLLGGMIDKVQEPTGAQGVMDMLGKVDMNMLGDIGGLFGGGANSVNGLLNSGTGIVESLLGNKMGGVVDLIAKVSGMKSGSTSSLLKMAAPFLMGMVGKQIKGKGLGFLKDMILGQKDAVANNMPKGMGSLLGLGFMDKVSDMAGNVGKAGMGAVTGAAAATTTAAKSTVAGATGAVKGAANVAESAGKSGLAWLKWALPLIIIGGLAYWLLSGGLGGAADDIKNAGDKVAQTTKDAANTVAETTKNAANSVADFASAAFAEVNEEAKSAMDAISYGANSAGAQMKDFISGGFKGDGNVRFNNLTFETGSAKISGESGVEVDNLAAILKAYPNVNIKVNGYTDNTGDAEANKTLSAARAMAVKGRLLAQGIDGGRISTEGHGSANPVASNDTDEGKAQNRRIEVQIVK